MIRDFFTSGRVVDFILLVVVAEFGLATWLNRGAPSRRMLLDKAFALAPGACLLLALRASLTGAPWTMTALWLTISLPLHIGDVVRRRV